MDMSYLFFFNETWCMYVSLYDARGFWMKVKHGHASTPHVDNDFGVGHTLNVTVPQCEMQREKLLFAQYLVTTAPGRYADGHGFMT
jgi:hypothetical protein